MPDNNVQEKQLKYCVFASATHGNFGEEQLAELSAEYKKSLSEDGVTGVMLYEDGNFFQVIEGDADKIDAAYKRFSAEKHTHKVVKIIEEEQDQRSFAHWTSAYSTAAKDIFVNQNTGRAYFSNTSEYQDIKSPKIKRLMGEFTKGRWRP